MPHHRARFTPRGRELVVRRVVDGGETFAQAAAWANVSRSTVWEWVRRWRQASAAERASLACLTDRSSRPHRSPNRVPAAEERRICELRRRTGWGPRTIAVEVGRPHSTVHQVLRRGGCSRPDPPERPPIIRYQWPCPGQLLHMDTKTLGTFEAPGHKVTGDRTKRSRRVGWEYVHSIVDDCSRLAYSEIRDGSTGARWWRSTAERYGASRSVLPAAQRQHPQHYGSHKDLAEKALAKLAGPHIPGPMKQLAKAIDAAHAALHKAEDATRNGRDGTVATDEPDPTVQPSTGEESDIDADA